MATTSASLLPLLGSPPADHSAAQKRTALWRRRPGRARAELRVACLSALWLLSACGPNDGARVANADQRPAVLASVTMLADSAAALLGAAADVRALIGPGVDPHLYRATRDDMQRLLQADLVLTVGLHLEANLESALERLNQPADSLPRLISLGALAPAERLLSTPIGTHSAASGSEAAGNEGVQLSSVDPHLWMDVSLWSAALSPLAAQLAQRFPSAALEIAAQTKTYQSELERLDGYIAACIASIPNDQRWLITAHDAFRYFGRRYGIEVRGLQGLSTESEAGLRELAELVELLVEQRIPAVFVESSVPEQGVRALILGAEERGHQVKLGGTLYSDATGPAGTPAASLVGMLVHNAETITLGLGGALPAGGFDLWPAEISGSEPEHVQAAPSGASSSEPSGAKSATNNASAPLHTNPTASPAPAQQEALR
jgi:manganese/zinc/iron transport system substrate-binding protein